MKAAVITPYYKEDISVLRRCHLSVLDQEVNCRHFMVADGFPNDSVSSWDCEHIILPSSHADNGNSPRAIGSISAMNQGYQLLLMLDADNWFCANHVSEALRIKQETPVTDIAALRRQMVLPDGTRLPDSPEDVANTHVDTSCFAFFESAFGILPLWAMMPKFLGPICDRIMLAGIRQRYLKVTWAGKKTCYYTSNYRGSYLAANRVLPEKTNDPDLRSIDRLLRTNKKQVFERTGLHIGLGHGD